MLLFTLMQPLKTHNIALLLHMGMKLCILLSSNDVGHVLGPVLIDLQVNKTTRQIIGVYVKTAKISEV